MATKSEGNHGRIYRFFHGDWNKRAQIAQVVGLIAIPISVIVLGYSVYQFNQTQKANAQQELDQQRQVTLNDYLNEMSTLVLNDHLLTSSPGDAVRTLAIAQTDTAVRNLDGNRKGILIRYLWEANLITGSAPIVTLFEVDLSGADFAGANLAQVNFSTNDLVGADFANSNPNGADLHKARLIGANLSNADLSCIRGSLRLGVSQGLLNLASGTIACSNLPYANLSDANLRNADLQDADLCGADLLSANLNGADFDGARYNSKPFLVYAHGKTLQVKATQWPRGSPPAGAVPVSPAHC